MGGPASFPDQGISLPPDYWLRPPQPAPPPPVGPLPNAAMFPPSAGPAPSPGASNPFADNPMTAGAGLGDMGFGPVRTDSMPMFPPSMPSPAPLPVAAPTITTPNSIWNPNQQSDADAAAFMGGPPPMQTPPAMQTPASSVAASDSATKEPAKVIKGEKEIKHAKNLEQEGEANIMGGLATQQAAVGNEREIKQAGADESFRIADAARAAAMRRATIEEAATTAQQKELADSGMKLQQYTDDLMSKRVDPYRLMKNSGLLIGVGAMIADSVNIGVDTVLGTSSKSHWDQYMKMMEQDTENQFKDIESGRANLNAGAQMLAQRQNVYKNDQMARHEMNAVKWEMAVQQVKDIRAKTTDDVEAAKLDGVIGELQTQGGKYQREFYKEAQAQAAAKAAAAAAQAERLIALKDKEAQQAEVKRHNLATEAIDADKAAAAGAKAGKEDADKFIPVPGKPDTFVKGGSTEQRTAISNKLSSLDTMEQKVDEALELLKTRSLSSSARDAATAAGKQIPGALYTTPVGGLRIGAELLGQSKEGSRLGQLSKEMTTEYNQGSGLGAMDKGTQVLLEKIIPDLDSPNPVDQDRARANLEGLKKDMRTRKEATINSVGGAEYTRIDGHYVETGKTGTAGMGNAPPDFQAR